MTWAWHWLTVAATQILKDEARQVVLKTKGQVSAYLPLGEELQDCLMKREHVPTGKELGLLIWPTILLQQEKMENSLLINRSVIFNVSFQLPPSATSPCLSVRHGFGVTGSPKNQIELPSTCFPANTTRLDPEAGMSGSLLPRDHLFPLLQAWDGLASGTRYKVRK